MTVDVVIITACCVLCIVSTAMQVWQTTRFWKALDQRGEISKAISEEALRRAKAGDSITYHHLFAELAKVRLIDHTWALTTFKDPYQLYPPYIRRLVGK